MRAFQGLISILVTLAVLVPTYSQRRRVVRPTTASKPAAWETQPFDDTVDTLPVGFSGHSLAQIYESLAKKPFVGKGEFESTIDFRARIAEERSLPLYGSLERNSLLAFVFPPGNEGFSTTYDADLNILEARLEWSTDYTPLSGSSLFWFKTTRNLGTTTGRTFFGRSVRIKVTRYDNYYLIGDIGSLTSAEKRNVFVTGVFTPLAIAREAKTRVRALVVCRLVDNALRYEYRRYELEISDPADVYRHDHGIAVKVEAIWFFDIKSGNVLAKLD
jgi:hypothetical protein